MEQLAGTLSGGNQQKVVLAKLLATEARILLFFDPTRGVDVGTKAEIFSLMRGLAARGFAILFFSTDLAELANVADRTLVMSYGTIAATLEGETMTEDAILSATLSQRVRGVSAVVALMRRHLWLPPLLVLMLIGRGHRHHAAEHVRHRSDQHQGRRRVDADPDRDGRDHRRDAWRDRPVDRRHPQPHHGDLRDARRSRFCRVALLDRLRAWFWARRSVH